MSLRRWSVMLTVVAFSALLTASSCQDREPPVGARAERVVMVSYDGVGANLARQWISAGVADRPGGLAEMAEHGFAVRRLRMVDPTLTAVNHWALATGGRPSETGIVSNRFHRPDAPITRTVSGYSSSSDVPALWTAARRQGQAVGTLLWPGADAGAVDRMGDFGIVWPERPLAASEVLELEPADAGTTGELLSKDGVAPLMWSTEVELRGAEPARVVLELATYDGTPDGSPRFDTVAVRRPGQVSWSLAGEREWFSIELEAKGAGDLRPWPYVLWGKPLRLDRFTGSLRLLRGACWRLHGYPDAFTEDLVGVVGPWPGVPDERLLEAWWLDMAEGIDLDTFLEQSERLDRYLDRIAARVLANRDVRLLMAYHPTPDEYQHAALIVSPEQWAYTPGTALAAREGLKRIGRSVDRSVAELWRAMDPERDVLLVVSDHGHAPLHDEVRVNRVLEGAGLVKVDEVDGRRMIAADTPMAATSSGGTANIYLNLEGREPGGVVKRSQAGELLARAARALADLEQDGRPVVERILKRTEAAALGLDSPNSGDLIVFLRPGFAASRRLDGEPIAPTRYYGQHGYLATHDAMCGMLFARGVGIPSRTIDELHVTEVAPLVATWLGFELR